MRYFEVLGISPPRLGLNSKDLESQYYKASLAVHPDRNLKQRDATERSAEVNEAYKTLKDPWSRAEYFVESRGVSLSSEGPSKLAMDFFDTPPDEMKATLDRESHRLDDLLRENFQSFDRGSDPTAITLALKSLIIEHKYLVSMLRNLSS